VGELRSDLNWPEITKPLNQKKYCQLWITSLNSVAILALRFLISLHCCCIIMVVSSFKWCQHMSHKLHRCIIPQQYREKWSNQSQPFYKLGFGVLWSHKTLQHKKNHLQFALSYLIYLISSQPQGVTQINDTWYNYYVVYKPIIIIHQQEDKDIN